MGVFDESEVEAGHKRLASSVSAYIEAMVAGTDLTRKALLAQDLARDNVSDHADYLAASQLGFRVVNGIGAATKLLDCGYYIQAAAIGRDIAEVGMLALYFSRKPDRLSEWRQSTQDRYKRFGRRKMRESLQATTRTTFDLLDKYFNLFSEFGTHPSSVSILVHHDGHNFQLGPHINQRLYTDLHSHIAFLSWHVVDVFGDTYRVLYKRDASELFPTETARFIDSFEGIRRATREPEAVSTSPAISSTWLTPRR